MFPLVKNSKYRERLVRFLPARNDTHTRVEIRGREDMYIEGTYGTIENASRVPHLESRGRFDRVFVFKARGARKGIRCLSNC